MSIAIDDESGRRSTLSWLRFTLVTFIVLVLLVADIIHHTRRLIRWLKTDITRPGDGRGERLWW